MKKLSVAVLFCCPVLLFCLLPAERILAQVPYQQAANGNVTTAAAQGTPYFYAYINDDDPAIRRVTLRWQIASEFNSDHFVLERSSELNPTHFAPLHELVSNSDSIGQAYTDMDNAPDGIISYYRLKIVLKNGDAFYSPVIAVDMSDKRSLALRPNVLTRGGTLHLNTNTDYHQPMTINFFDAGGRMIATYLVNSSYFDINTSGWSKGIYIYRITDGRHPLIEAGKIMIM